MPKDLPILAIDQEKYNITKIVQSLYHYVLRDYIARANEREVMENLYKFYTESEVALISKAQLRQYQEMEKLIIDTSTTVPNFLKDKK